MSWQDKIKDIIGGWGICFGQSNLTISIKERFSRAPILVRSDSLECGDYLLL